MNANGNHVSAEGTPGVTLASDESLASLEIAEARVRERFAVDSVAQRLGAEFLEIRPGRVTMAVAPDPGMINGHGLLHGGACFTLGDTCFAYVCESLDMPSVTRHAEITYITPGDGMTRLVARGEERTRYGRNIVVDVALHDQEGRHMAEMRVFGVATRKDR